MSDERQSSSVALFTELHHDRFHSSGSLKRKLGQTIPISRREQVTYPSPPMSTPPSPTRPSPRPAFNLSTEQQAVLSGSSFPSTTSTQTSAPVTSAASQPAPPSFFERSAGPSTTFIATTFSESGSIGQAAAFPSGQNVFSLGQTASSGPTVTSPTQARSGRKAKAHVASACMNCKRAHLSCDAQRPCTRCVTSGKQDTCFDVPHKKRGRPRLREESEFKVEQMPLEQSALTSAPITPGATGPPPGRPIARTRHQRTESLRSLRSQGSEGSSGSSIPTPGYPPILQAGWNYQAPRPPSSGMAAHLIPTAFLDLDLNFIRANRPFQQIVSSDQDVRGRQLQDVVASADGENFLAMRGRLEGERESRDPAFMPPILQPGEDPIQGVMEDDVERLASGFFDQTYTWTRAVSGAQRETFPARVRLAKAVAYFVVVTLPSFRPVEMLPPQPVPSGPPPGFVMPPRVPTLPSQQSDPRIETQSAPPGPYYPQPGMLPGTPQFLPPATYPLQSARTYQTIQPPPPPGQPYPPTAQLPLPSQQQQPSTPRLPTTEPPMQITPITPLTAAAAPRPQLASSIQLPPLTGTPGTRPAAPAMGGPSEPQPEQQQQQDSDDEESPKKRRRMDISDVLQR